MATYIGQNLTQGSRQRVSYTATAGQTTFSAGYAPGFVDVYQNGLLLPTSEYTATNGSTVVLNTGAALNDEIEIIGQFLFAVEDTVSSSSGGTFSGAVTIDSNLTVSGYLAGPATFTIDPAVVGDNTGTVVIAGNLQVDGTTTTINSTTLDVDDLNITVASGAADSAAANGAGITVDGASATLTYVSAGDNWNFNKDLDINGGLTLSGNLSLGDNNKINFGAGNDLQIHHNGTNSYIDDTGTGALIVRSNLVMFRNAADTEDLLTLTEDGSVQLYYDNTLLLFTGTDATTGDYVQVNGDIVASNGFVKCAPNSGGVALTYNDGGGNANIAFNHTSQQPDQNGNSGRISVNTDSTTSASMSIEVAENVTAGASTATTGAALFTVTAQTLNYSGSARIATTNDGVTVTGAVTDSVSDVRTPRYTAISTATTISDEGVYYCTNAPTLTLGAPEVGAVMTIYNNNASSMTLSRGSTLVTMRIGADNNNTNNTSLTLGAYSTTTITMFLANFALVTGTDVS